MQQLSGVLSFTHQSSKISVRSHWTCHGWHCSVQEHVARCRLDGVKRNIKVSQPRQVQVKGVGGLNVTVQLVLDERVAHSESEDARQGASGAVASSSDQKCDARNGAQFQICLMRAHELCQGRRDVFVGVGAAGQFVTSDDDVDRVDELFVCTRICGDLRTREAPQNQQGQQT